MASDTLWDSLRLALRTEPIRCGWISLVLLWNRAKAKEFLATRIVPDPVKLSYREQVLRLIREERENGVPILLVTGAHQRIALKVAEHVGLFDEVIATHGKFNCKGRRKAELLVERFGTGGYDYIGNDRADIPVWKSCHRGYTVDYLYPGVRLLTIEQTSPEG